MLTNNTLNINASLPEGKDLERISLFGALSSAQATELWRYLHVRQCDSAERIFRQGELPNEIFIVLKGKVDLVVDTADVSRIEASYRDGDMLGESAFIGIQPQVGTAIAAAGQSVDLLVLSRSALMDISEQNPTLFGLLMMNIAREVSRKYHRHIEID